MFKGILLAGLLMIATPALADDWRDDALKAAEQFTVHYVGMMDDPVTERLFIHKDYENKYVVRATDKRMVTENGIETRKEVNITQRFDTLKEAWDFSMQIQRTMWAK